MSRRLVNAASLGRFVVALLVIPACAASLAATDPAASRHCVLLAAEYETQGTAGASLDEPLRHNTRLVQARMLQRMLADHLVANTFLVDIDSRAAAADKVRKAATVTGCDTVVEVRELVMGSLFGGAFGFDVAVERVHASASAVVYSRQYRYGFDQATTRQFSYIAFTDAAWADLSQASVLDVDRDTTAVAPAAVRAEYERTVAAWPSTLREYHLRQIVRSSQALANASLKRLHEPDPPDFAVLAGIDSDDAGGATRGGDVGWVAPDNMPSAIAIAVQALDGATGLVDYAISTGDSWHVVEVLGSRAVPPPPFDQVRGQVAAKLRWSAVVPDATWAQALQP